MTFNHTIKLAAYNLFNQSTEHFLLLLLLEAIQTPANKKKTAYKKTHLRFSFGFDHFGVFVKAVTHCKRQFRKIYMHLRGVNGIMVKMTRSSPGILHVMDLSIHGKGKSFVAHTKKRIGSYSVYNVEKITIFKFNVNARKGRRGVTSRSLYKNH